MMVSQYIKTKFELSLDLSKNCLEEYRLARHLDLDKVEELSSVDSSSKNISGIRVGLDFLRRPLSKEGFSPCTQNRHILIDQTHKIKADIELGIRKLVMNQVEIYLNGHVEPVGPYTEEGCIQLELESAIRLSLWFIYRAGRSDGFEDGRAVLGAILGDNPSATSWYPFAERSTEDGPHGKLGFGAIEPFYEIPVKVESKSNRDTLHVDLLQLIESDLKAVELLISKLSRFRLGLFLLGKQPGANISFDGNQVQSELNLNVMRCADKIHKLGHSCGFQSGQQFVKIAYNDVYRDTNTYTFVERGSQVKLLVDTSMPHHCECDICPKCIASRTKVLRSKLQEQWDKTTVEYDFYFNEVKRKKTSKKK